MTMSQGTVPASVRIHRWRGVAAVTLTAGELQATFVPEMNMLGASVPGGVIAFYQLGYGIAAFGAGPLQDAGVGLPTIFGFTAVAAVVMGGLSFVLAPPTTRGALHPCMNARRPFRTDRMMRADP
jgi:hypothetical protein